MAAVPTNPRPSLGRKLLRGLGALLAVLLLGALAASGWFYYVATSSLPQLEGTIAVSGLGSRVTVVRDAQGVPHISAASLEDLFFAQGYVTAQDRLWQMDMARRYAKGEIAEILGADLLEHDREQRILQIRHAAQAAVGGLPWRERKFLEAYARGVNALMEAQRDRLPIEFRLLRYQPRPWTVEDSLLVGANMSKMLNYYQVATEIGREKVLNKIGPELTADLYPDSSSRDRPPGWRPPPPLVEVASDPSPESAPQSEVRTTEPALFLTETAGLAPGSNNWVVSGAHTVTGKSLLSNDMHLPHQIPNIWYEAHLTAGDFDVAGVTLPGVPFVIVGHNRRIAWGFTNLGPDVTDIFIETFNPQGEYQTPEGWKQPERRREVIKVKGKPDVTVEALITRHGPIVSELVPGETRKLALQWTLYDPTTLDLPFFAINSAQNWDEFRAALSRFGGPAQNVVYADVDGHIGYQATGRIPIRTSGDGSIPVPAHDNSHAWTGYVPYDELPRVFDPPSGILATANGRIVPDGYKHMLTRQWASPHRTVRIYQGLESGRKLAAADMLALQTDVQSDWDRFSAQQFAAAIERSPQASQRARQAADILRVWQGSMSADSAAATLVARSRRHLMRLLYTPKLQETFNSYRWFMSSAALEKILVDRPPRWLPPNYTSYEALLVVAVEVAVNDPDAPQDLASWKWGNELPVEVQHPIFGRVPLLRRWTGAGPLPQSGNGFTVKQVGKTFGPSQRFTADLSNLDASTMNILSGQSGQIFSPHYMDQWSAWYEGKTFPLVFSSEAVARAARRQLVLEPKAR
ncbi:MAG: penicillin acylase family protein [Terriglobales bacterium]